VKALGSLNSTARSQAQTDLAVFYSGNIVELSQRIMRDLIVARQTSIGDSARVFALANMAASDALIASWDAKNYYNFWRPITAIRDGDNDGNSQTLGDPNWSPFISTPPYSEYTSGANNLYAAATRILAHVFGDQTTFTVVSPQAVRPKVYVRFSDLAQDMVDVRIYQGIHFRFSDGQLPLPTDTRGRR
jgi:hypothetical protein